MKIITLNGAKIRPGPRDKKPRRALRRARRDKRAHANQTKKSFLSCRARGVCRRSDRRFYRPCGGKRAGKI